MSDGEKRNADDAQLHQRRALHQFVGQRRYLILRQIQRDQVSEAPNTSWEGCETAGLDFESPEAGELKKSVRQLWKEDVTEEERAESQGKPGGGDLKSTELLSLAGRSEDGEVTKGAELGGLTQDRLALRRGRGREMQKAKMGEGGAEVGEGVGDLLRTEGGDDSGELGIVRIAGLLEDGVLVGALFVQLADEVGADIQWEMALQPLVWLVSPNRAE